MSSVVPPRDALTAGLFGKLPSRGDFVRINVAGAGLEFAAHLEASGDICRRAGCDPLVPESFFLYRAPKSPVALVGMLRPSNDNVGRTFPLAFFTEIEVESAAGNFDILPLAFAPFFAAAGALADDGPTLAPNALAERLEELPFPTIEEFEAAQARGDALPLETSAAAFADSLFGPTPKGRRHFAFHAAATACEQSRELVGDAKTGITLALPLCGPFDVTLWLGAVRRFLGEQTVCPNILWTAPKSSPSCGSVKIEVPPTPGKLLVSFGAPSSSAQAFLVGALNDSPRLWPVAGCDEAAIERVKASLTPVQLEVLADADATLDAVVTAFGG